jgi:glycine cleavage system H protein
MDGFSYSDIFATKGIEYLIIIAFLVLLIPFWMILNKQAKVNRKIQKALGALTAGILQIPQGLFYSKNHTWMYLEKSGSAMVGLDDLLLHITGEVKFNNHKNPGEMIHKGELLTDIEQNGKLLRILSPVSGTITNINSIIHENPGMLNEDPYDKGWICKIKPSKWIVEADACYFAEAATHWSTIELERFKDFLAMSMRNYAPDPSLVILQDGGELCDHTLSELPGEIWRDFEKEFLNLNRS